MIEQAKNIQQYVASNGSKRTVFDYYRHGSYCGKQSISGWFKKESTVLYKFGIS